MARLAPLVAVLIAFLSSARGGTLTIDSPAGVQDAPLLDGEFSGWNFGASPLLEVGFMGGIYTEHHASSVIRFDLTGVRCADIQSAKLRLYKPKDFIQTQPLVIRAYEISRASSAWSEGTQMCGNSGVKFADNIHHEQTLLATAIAPADRSAWLEFPIPPQLVQRWLEAPESNSGLYLCTAGPEQQWGQHVYFHASESFRGNTPQLVIVASTCSQAATDNNEPLPYKLPDPHRLDAWLKENGRLARFTRDCGMTTQQAQAFQMFDTAVREQLIVGRYQRPLQRLLQETRGFIEKGDEPAVRQRLQQMHELLLKWEFIRETSWYTSGPIADFLSPRQLGQLFGDCIFGQMQRSAEAQSKEIWNVIPPDKMQAHNRAVMEQLTRRLGLSTEQQAALAPRIDECEAEENQNLAAFRIDLQHCQQLVKAGADSDELFGVIKDLHVHHERFLYYQSIYSRPRWELLMKHAPTLPFAQWIVEVRREHYERAVSNADKRAASQRSSEPLDP